MIETRKKKIKINEGEAKTLNDLTKQEAYL